MKLEEIVFTTAEEAVREIYLQMLRALRSGARMILSPLGNDYAMPTLGGEALEVVVVLIPNNSMIHERICEGLTALLATPQPGYGGLPMFQLEGVTILDGVVTITEKWD